MNALVKKEIRLLLPSFLIGVALTIANWFLKEERLGYNDYAFFVSFVFCPAIAVFMALNSFGAEISAGTFSMLLAQPVSRNRIWKTKALLLAAAFFISGFLWCGLLYLRVELFKVPVDAGYFRNLFFFAGLFLLVIYSGALWTVLLLRQVAAAFWFTLLTPAALLVLITSLWPQEYAAARQSVIIAAMLAYSLAGFFFARRLFLRAQDVAWTGGTIAWPEMRGLQWWGERPREPQAPLVISSSAASPRQQWRPRRALFWKEVQLHQSGFVLAGALALLHLGVLATRKFGNFQKNSSTEFILEIFWGLWLVMPLLVGCAAAAEERKLGTIEGQLCLPVRLRTQFSVKAGGVLLLSLLLGVAMPLLLEGTRILPNHHFFPQGFHFENIHSQVMIGGQTSFSYCLETINHLSPLLILSGIAAAIGLISFYASTLARNTLQALAPAVLGLLLTWFLIFANANPGTFGLHLPRQGGLIYFIGVPVLAITLLGLASWNFQRGFIGGQVWRRNLLVLPAMLGLIAVATAAIYHRAWEKLTPFEPAHGAARITRSNPATLRDQWNTVFVRLGDGRIWTDSYALNIDLGNPLALFLGDIRLASLGGGHFCEGSNWMNVILLYRYEKVGLKTDGTLWLSETPAKREQLASGGWKLSNPGDLVRYDSETNWSGVVQDELAILLLKTDGTLWRWGAKGWNGEKEWPGLHSFTPHQWGTETNWAEVFWARGQIWLRKTDGTVWAKPNYRSQMTKSLEFGRWRGITEASRENLLLGIRSDGTFRAWAKQRFVNASRGFNWVATDFQIGKEANWLDAAGRGEKIVTLKNDGTLWQWTFHPDYGRRWDTARDEREMLALKPVRLGTHADWQAIASADGGIISLAADGSLWYWPLEDVDHIGTSVGGYRFFGNGDSYVQPLLDISRKPQLLGNVFSAQH